MAPTINFRGPLRAFGTISLIGILVCSGRAADSYTEEPGNEGDGKFTIGPEYKIDPDLTDRGNAKGKSFEFTMPLSDSKIFPGTDSTLQPEKKQVRKERKIFVYVPAAYKDGTKAPFLIIHDGPGQLKLVRNALDNLTISKDANRKLPAFVAIAVENGGNDGKKSERGLEYDTMSGRYAEFVESEVLPLVERQYNVKLTKDPEGRATMGCSSGGSAALIMAWYHPELYHRVLTYSGTYVNQQWPSSAETPHGAWEFHERLIPNSPVKPIRLWMQVGDRDLYSPNLMRDNMHDWVVANENMARVLAAKGYHYQFVFSRNAGHCDRPTKLQTFPAALEWLWRGYVAR
jgi:iron(III)-enterobactin esterase